MYGIAVAEVREFNLFLVAEVWHNSQPLCCEKTAIPTWISLSLISGCGLSGPTGGKLRYPAISSNAFLYWTLDRDVRH
jgi:hypothetical protein